jgi:DNA polymerase III epsilon subunit-like protein
MDVMIDIETLGRAAGCAVLSIGACTFDGKGVGERFYETIDLESCAAVGLTMEPATIAWWMQQSDAARSAAMPSSSKHISEVLSRLVTWFAQVNGERVWCHGATFDVPILDAAYKACGLTQPWSFWNARDTRTLYDLAQVSPDRSQGTHHHALDDAIAQARAAVEAFARLGVSFSTEF